MPRYGEAFLSLQELLQDMFSTAMQFQIMFSRFQAVQEVDLTVIIILTPHKWYGN